MKLSGFLLVIPLLAVTITSAYAKENTLYKTYGKSAPTVAAQQAKSATQQKRLVLQHPEKMAGLTKQYVKMQQTCGTRATGVTRKGGFVAKAQRQQAFKHDCPYQHGVSPERDAKTMHGMKRMQMKAHGQQGAGSQARCEHGAGQCQSGTCCQ